MSVRDTIRAAKPFVSEYTLKDGGKVWVRAFNGKGRANYIAYIEKAKANGGVKTEAVAAMGVCDENGTLVYDYQNQAHLDELSEYLDGRDLDGISIQLFQISGLSKDAVEDASKNSEASPNSSSGSSSPPMSSTAP